MMCTVFTAERSRPPDEEHGAVSAVQKIAEQKVALLQSTFRACFAPLQKWCKLGCTENEKRRRWRLIDRQDSPSRCGGLGNVAECDAVIGPLSPPSDLDAPRPLGQQLRLPCARVQNSQQNRLDKDPAHDHHRRTR